MLSRRDFLKKLAASAVALALDPYQGIQVDDHQYTNQRLGVSFKKPVTWDYSSIADFAALRERQVLDRLLEDEPEPFKDPHNLPVVLVEDLQHRSGYFAPSISLWDEAHNEPVPKDQVAAHREVMIWAFENTYREVVLHHDPQTIQLNGAHGTISRWSYLHELDDETVHHLMVRSLVVFRDNRVHTFHLTDQVGVPIVPDHEWDSFIDSIQYV